MKTFGAWTSRRISRAGLLVAMWMTTVGSAPGQTVPDGLDMTFRVEPHHLLLAGGEPALMRLDLQQFDVSGPGKAVEHHHRAVTIMDAAGRDRGVITVAYDGMRRIGSLKGRIRNADGRLVRNLKKADVRDVSAISDVSLYDDSRVRIAELYHDQFPYTVEFEVELRHNGLINWPTWYPQSSGDGVEFAAFELRVPADMMVRHTSRNLTIVPITTEERGRRTIRWSAANLSPFDREDFGPQLVEQVGSVHTAPAAFQVENRGGDMSSWQAFGQWYADLSRGAEILPPEAVQDVRHLLADAPDPGERVRRIYAYVQQRTRYVSVQLGLGGWKPFDATYVHQRGYGDCKALTNYTIALLKAAGVAAYPALIRHGIGAAGVLDDFPSNQFNHAIAFVPLAADTVWLETTSQTMPYGHLGAANEDRFALVVYEHGGELIRTPKSRADENFQARRGRIVLNTDGGAQADVVTSYAGNQQDRLRHALARASRKQRDEWLHRTIDIPQFELVSADFGGVDGRGKTITLPISLRLPRYASAAGDRLFLVPTLMDRWGTVPPETDNRTQDVDYFSYAFLDTDSLEYALPQGYDVESVPEPVRIETAFALFEAASVVKDDRTLQSVRRLQVTETRLPPSEYDRFREFLAQVARSDRAQVVLVRRGS